jgi:hypothetical protein
VTGVRLVFPDGSGREYEWATIRPERVNFDARLYRGAFADTWYVEGTRRQEPERFSVRFEVADADLDSEASADLMRGLLRDCERAAVVQGWFGQFRSAGVAARSLVPIESGFALEVVFTANVGRFELPPELRGRALGRGWATGRLYAAVDLVYVYAGSTQHYAGSEATFAGSGP